MIPGIYNRPMFQTPQRKAGGGIMAGVAPINQGMGPMMLENGGDPGILSRVITPEPSRMSEFFSFEKTPEGSGTNLRDLTDFLIVDPSDPVDIAMAAATAPLILYPPALIAVNLARAGYKANKVQKMAQKVANLQKSAGGTGRLAGYMQAQGIKEVVGMASNPEETYEGVKEIGSHLGEIGTLTKDIINQQSGESVNPYRKPSIIMKEDGSIEFDESDPLESEKRNLPGDPGGIENLVDFARNISQAREMGADTFVNKAGKELAAVTKEELDEFRVKAGNEDLGYTEALRKYLNEKNAMEMNRGGIAMLANGGEAKTEDVKPDMPDDIKGFLDFYEMDFETFMKMPEEKQQVYIENFQGRQDLIDTVLDNPLASFMASVGDTLAYLPKAPGRIYDAIKYSDLAKQVGITDPLAEPADDPSFSEDLESAISQRAPDRSSFSDYEYLKTPPPEPPPSVVDPKSTEKIPTEEEPTTFLGRVLDGLDTITGGKIEDPMKKRALLAAVGRRPLGTSRGQAYVKALQEEELIDIRRKEQESAAQARIANQIPEIAKTIEYLKTQMPDTSVQEILTVFLGKGNDDQQKAAEIISAQAESIRKDPTSIGRFEQENIARADQGLAPLDYDRWVAIKATQLARAAFFQSDLGSSSTNQMSLEEMQEILAKQKE